MAERATSEGATTHYPPALHWHTNGFQDDIGELLDQALELLDAGLRV